VPWYVREAARITRKEPVSCTTIDTPTCVRREDQQCVSDAPSHAMLGGSRARARYHKHCVALQAASIHPPSIHPSIHPERTRAVPHPLQLALGNGGGGLDAMSGQVGDELVHALAPAVDPLHLLPRERLVDEDRVLAGLDLDLEVDPGVVRLPDMILELTGARILRPKQGSSPARLHHTDQRPLGRPPNGLLAAAVASQYLLPRTDVT
jgi:hypothetical protein